MREKKTIFTGIQTFLCPTEQSFWVRVPSLVEVHIYSLSLKTYTEALFCLFPIVINSATVTSVLWFAVRLSLYTQL